PHVLPETPHRGAVGRARGRHAGPAARLAAQPAPRPGAVARQLHRSPLMAPASSSRLRSSRPGAVPRRLHRSGSLSPGASEPLVAPAPRFPTARIVRSTAVASGAARDNFTTRAPGPRPRAALAAVKFHASG